MCIRDSLKEFQLGHSGTFDTAFGGEGRDNKREYKHQPVLLLERNSSRPYTGIKPKIVFDQKEKHYHLLTSPLFEYLITKKDSSDKKRLAGTAQYYLAKGLFEIVKLVRAGQFKKAPIFFSGGLANNKIISSYLTQRGFIVNRRLARGDENISFGQLMYYLYYSADSGN